MGLCVTITIDCVNSTLAQDHQLCRDSIWLSKSLSWLQDAKFSSFLAPWVGINRQKTFNERNLWRHPNLLRLQNYQGRYLDGDEHLDNSADPFHHFILDLSVPTPTLCLSYISKIFNGTFKDFCFDSIKHCIVWFRFVSRVDNVSKTVCHKCWNLEWFERFLSTWRVN